MKKRFTRRILFAALLAAALAASARAALERVETYPAGHFTDVAETDWFEDAFGAHSCVDQRKTAFLGNKRRLV